MNYGAIPSTWVALLGRMDAGFLLRVKEACDKEGVAQNDFDGVKRVANFISYMERFKFAEEK